ncbi:MAG: hypothetical protein ACRD2O_09095 [Terriglobia bacterium]
MSEAKDLSFFRDRAQNKWPPALPLLTAAAERFGVRQLAPALHTTPVSRSRIFYRWFGLSGIIHQLLTVLE